MKNRMNCETARMLIAISGRQGTELDPIDGPGLQTHLAECASCAALVRIEKAFDDRLAKAMVEVPVPERLSDRIQARLQQQLLAESALAKSVVFRQRVWRVSTIAASLLLCFGAWTALKFQSVQPLNLNQVIAQADREIQDPRTELDRFLSKHDVRFTPPQAFNLNLLATYGITPFQGKEVPMLYFRDSGKNVVARVYILRSTEFDFATTQERLSGGGHFGHQVELLRDPHSNHIAYVVLYSGESLEPFLERFLST